MAKRGVNLTGRERLFDEDEIIVSKTDLKGRITYANQVFCRVSQFSEDELLGQPHNIVRHRDMPRCVFKLLWDTIQSGKEIFAYVLNRAKSGDHYWVFAHVTPSYNTEGRMIGYHSSRRCPDRSALEKIKSVYRLLLTEEQKFSNPKEGISAATAKLNDLLQKQKISYEEFVFSLHATPSRVAEKERVLV
ncbi:MAG: PAS domain-containing protein [Planctomycetota bacterium]